MALTKETFLKDVAKLEDPFEEGKDSSYEYQTPFGGPVQMWDEYLSKILPADKEKALIIFQKLLNFCSERMGQLEQTKRYRDNLAIFYDGRAHAFEEAINVLKNLEKFDETLSPSDLMDNSLLSIPLPRPQKLV